jgi:hypothetical protein
MTTPTFDELEHHARLLSVAVRNILLSLSRVKYDGQLKVSKEFLVQGSVVVPSEIEFKNALEALLLLNKLVAQDPVELQDNYKFGPNDNESLGRNSV